VTDEAERTGGVARIEEILVSEGKGEAGGKIQEALKDRGKILDDTLAEVARFTPYLEEYQRSPELVRQRERTRMLNELFDEPGIVKWWMPAGQKRVILTLNKDPLEIRQAESEALRRKAEKK